MGSVFLDWPESGGGRGSWFTALGLGLFGFLRGGVGRGFGRVLGGGAGALFRWIGEVC